MKKYEKGYKFISDLRDSKSLSYDLVTQIKTPLRGYQLEGIRWLMFLMRYNLNAALCDDMGLGKTIQSLTVLQELLYLRKIKKIPNINGSGKKLIKESNGKDNSDLSLIIVPSTLTEHWLFEINRYMDLSIIKPIIYTSSSEKKSMVAGNYNIIIMSYQTMYKNIDTLKNESFFFCILDEAHTIKNTKTK